MKTFFLILVLASQLLGAFGYGASITVDRTKVPNTDQINFPVLISGVYDGTGGEPDLRLVASGGKVTDAQGDDIVFGTAAGCASLLSWEIERYIGTTGEIIAHARIPTLTTASDHVFRMCYGDAGVTTFQSTATATWNSGYLYVGHLPDGTSLTVLDSTSNAYNGTVTGGVTASTGKIGGAATFNGTTGYVTMSGLVTVVNSPITMSAWVNPSSSAAGTIMGNEDTDWPYLYKHSDDTIRCGMATLSDPAITNTTIATSTWTLVTCTHAGVATTPHIYFNGVEQTYSNAGGTGVLAGATGFRLGAYTGPILLFTGAIDEPRISNVVRSDDWKVTEYNNQNSPSTFYTMGAEVASATAIKRRVIQ